MTKGQATQFQNGQGLWTDISSPKKTHNWPPSTREGGPVEHSSHRKCSSSVRDRLPPARAPGVQRRTASGDMGKAGPLVPLLRGTRNGVASEERSPARPGNGRRVVTTWSREPPLQHGPGTGNEGPNRCRCLLTAARVSPMEDWGMKCVGGTMEQVCHVF